jgi:DNA polymerase III epsilon subunit-like protein
VSTRPLITQPVGQFGVCLDWETTGAKYGGTSSRYYQGIELGAIVFNTSTFEPIEELSCLVQFRPERYEWTAEAERIHGKSRELLAREGLPQEAAAERLLALLARYFPAGARVLVLGHNCEFDVEFTDQLLRTVGVAFTPRWAEAEGVDVIIPVSHVRLDTSSAGFLLFGRYKADRLFEVMGFPPRAEHSALEDARLTLRTAQVLREVFNHGLAELLRDGDDDGA